MQAIKIPITLKSNANAGVQVKAFINSGAQERFIDWRTVWTLKLQEISLNKPIPIYNIERTFNQLENIQNYVSINITIGKTTKKERMLVTQLRKQEVILGIDWLKERNPQINWKVGTLDFTSRKVVIENLPDKDNMRIGAMETIQKKDLVRESTTRNTNSNKRKPRCCGTRCHHIQRSENITWNLCQDIYWN